jgi:hypothetical protein
LFSRDGEISRPLIHRALTETQALAVAEDVLELAGLDGHPLLWRNGAAATTTAATA